nr:hypothetical protein [Myxococcota bacterium]
VPASKFPALANLPTMIAEPDPETPPPAAGPGEAPGERGGDAGSAIDPNDATVLEMGSMDLGETPPPRDAGGPGSAIGGAIGGGYPASDRPTQPQAQVQLSQQPRPNVNLPASYPVMDAQMSAEMASGASVFPSQQRSSGGSRPPDNRSASGPQDPQRALDLASPVGQQYPEHDWAAAASAPARALPAWMLALVFLGAIGVALAITILIATIAR